MDALAGKPIFKIQPPPYVTEDLVAFVREKLVSVSNQKNLAAAEPLPNRV
jgi:hypothetical protein